MIKARLILSAAALAVLLPVLAAAEPPAPAEAAPAVGAPACKASLIQPVLPELPALPGQPAEPMYTACNVACTNQCNEYYQDCIAPCPGYRGDPCLTECRSGRIACYSGCC